MAKKAKLFDVVRVTWHDAWMESSEEVVESMKNECKVVTYGVLVRDGDVVSVAPERTDDKYWRGTTNIPRAIVVSIEVVEAS